MAITLNDIKKLSPKAKALIIIFIIILIGYFDWFYFLSAAMEKKTSLEKKLEEVQSQVKEKERSALQFNKYKADVAALTDSYKVALQKLPDQREIPGLFHSVAQAGQDTGIEFLLFEPKAAIPKALDKPAAKEETKAGALLKPSDGKKPPPKELETFYEEIPVNVTVIGTFQNIVYFFEKVAKLPRIVNISDISMGERKDIKGKGYVINTACTIKTYMFVDKKEPVSEKAK
jgi:type IV pilus assembly protein PilO